MRESSQGAGDVERIATGYSGQLSILLAGGALSINLGRQALPPLLPNIIEDLSISPAAAGLALTVMWTAYAVLQYPSGRVADVLTRKTALIAGLIGIVAGFLLLSRTGRYELLVVSTGLVGVGTAFYMIAMRTLLSDLFVDRRGVAFGVNIAAGQIGSILAAGLAVAALSFATWQATFLPVVALLLVITLGIHAVSREPYRLEGIDLNLRGTIARVFGDARIRWLVVAYTLVIFSWQGAIGFLPTYLQATKGFSTALASGGFASVFAIGIVVQPVAGSLSDRGARLPVAGGATLLSGVGLGIVLVGTSSAVIIGGIVVFAAGLLAFSPVTQAYLMDVFPDETKGGDLGAFKTVYEGLGGLGPTYVGVVAGASSYTTAYAGFIACLLGSAGLVAWLARRT